MRRKPKFRLSRWIFAALILIGASAGLLISGKSLPMQETATARSTEEVVESESGETKFDVNTDTVKADIQNAIDVFGDFANVAITGAESKFENGYEALAGRGKLKDAADGENISDGENQIDEGSETDAVDVESQTLVLTEATLSYVVDGDTLDVLIAENTVRVRLIGIDTPESVHADEEKNTVWGTYASDHTKEILKDIEKVYLEYGEESTDKYGRTLAYVWLSEDTSDMTHMLNARILSEGYAMDKVYEPNDKYSNVFSNLRKSAQENKRGLWSDEGVEALWTEHLEN